MVSLKAALRTALTKNTNIQNVLLVDEIHFAGRHR